jgi:NitT/TauT family transport system permease protein
MSEPTNKGAGPAAPAGPSEPDGKPGAPAKVPGADATHALSYGDLPARSPKRHPLQGVLDLFQPNRAIPSAAMRVVIAIEAAIALLIWWNSPFKVLPRPDDVLRGLQQLWFQEGLGPELGTSFMLNLEALAWATGISLILSYLTVLPVFRPIVVAISKGRFLSLVGFTFVFTLIAQGGHQLKVQLLVFGVTVFYVTSMASVIAQIPREKFDHARTLRMGEWRVVWEVVVLGTIDQAFEVTRQNAAIGWMMLTMVEGIVRSEGGVGTVLLNANKHFNLAQVFAIQLVILIVGLIQDYAIGLLRRLACPYADLTLEKR